MVTFKGALRSYSSAVRSIERNQQRQLRESARRFKEQQKINDFNNASNAVQEYEDYVSLIQSIHKDCSTYIDWEQIKNDPKPLEPILSDSNEKLAIEKLNSYIPSFFDKLLFQTGNKTVKFQLDIVRGKEKDKLEFDNAKEELSNWNLLQEICTGILNKDPKGYSKAIEYFNPFSDIAALGSKLYIEFNKDFAVIDLLVKSEDVVPNYILSQTTTGKLSKKNMPISRFNEIYQDYICSAALRLAREVHAYLPVKFAVINANGNIVNTTTGMIEEQSILSVAIPKETLNNLNFDTIDPSDSMKNFIHNMKFSKTKGFSIIDKVDIEKLK